MLFLCLSFISTKCTIGIEGNCMLEENKSTKKRGLKEGLKHRAAVDEDARYIARYAIEVGGQRALQKRADLESKFPAMDQPRLDRISIREYWRLVKKGQKMQLTPHQPKRSIVHSIIDRQAQRKVRVQATKQQGTDIAMVVRSMNKEQAKEHITRRLQGIQDEKQRRVVAHEISRQLLSDQRNTIRETRQAIRGALGGSVLSRLRSRLRRARL